MCSFRFPWSHTSINRGFCLYSNFHNFYIISDQNFVKSMQVTLNHKWRQIYVKLQIEPLTNFHVDVELWIENAIKFSSWCLCIKRNWSREKCNQRQSVTNFRTTTKKITIMTLVHKFFLAQTVSNCYVWKHYTTTIQEEKNTVKFYKTTSPVTFKSIYARK